MNMLTNFTGRLRNTSLPSTSGLLPLFEAVVNSIHGIEEADLNNQDGTITVEIIRKPRHRQLAIDDAKKRRGPEALGDISGFKIIDNGIGFTDPNMTAFKTLDTEHKAAKGGRGVGRLLWLKAFKSARVVSYFDAGNGTRRIRQFIFDASHGVNRESNKKVTAETTRQTIIHLVDFQPRYRDNSRKTLDAIAESILEHCLWYFVRAGGAPRISIHDGDNCLALDDLYEQHMHAAAVPDSLTINHVKFDLIHIKLRHTSLAAHAIALCANKRLVTEEKLDGKIRGLHGKITDETGEFIYKCYVSSPFLDETIRPERTGFDIPEIVDALFEKTDIALPQIRLAVIEKIAAHLGPCLATNLARSKERVDRFVSEIAPRYRPIMARIPEGSLNIDPEISDKDLDMTLHKCLADIENELLAEGHEIMVPVRTEQRGEYEKRLADYLSKANDIKKSDLANYVSHRKVILDLLQMAIQRKSDGTYAREDLIHSLILPMGQTSNDVLLDDCNLWLVDERLAFHNYLASDKTLLSMPITTSSDTKEPDLCALKVFDNPMLVSEGTSLPLASITVVELKRPMRDDSSAGEKDDPVEQAIGYLDRIRNGQVQTAQGRPIPQSADIPGFCYILADITPSFEQRCLIHHDLKWTHDHLGFFGYKQNCKAFIAVISFDQLVNAAKERNRAFFDKLGLPAK